MSQTSSDHKHPPTPEVIASWLGAGGLLADAVGWERVGWQLTRLGKRREDEIWPRGAKTKNGPAQIRARPSSIRF